MEGVLYPLVASTCTKDELDRIDRVIASAKCNALGLSEHFPRALLYGPLSYGECNYRPPMRPQ
jgi:hypothetical protein